MNMIKLIINYDEKSISTNIDVRKKPEKIDFSNLSKEGFDKKVAEAEKFQHDYMGFAFKEVA